MKKIKIVYDESCSFCLWLGNLVRKHSGDEVKLLTWAELQKIEAFQDISERYDLSNLESIAAIENDEIIFGHGAWELLLKHYPGLSSLHWLAEKVGLRQPFVAGMQKAAHGVRSLCSSCGFGSRLKSRQTQNQERSKKQES